MNRDQVTRLIAVFESIYIPYPPHKQLQERCAYLIELRHATLGRPQKGVRALAPTGSGKTTAVLEFIRQYEARYPRTEDYVPIVHVPLERATTPKKLMMSILDYFGDRYSSHGNEQTLKRRVIACFQRFGTELLIIDEVQHLNARRSDHGDVTDSLKRFLDDGIVPIMFLGTDEAHDLFTRNLQLSGRLLASGDLTPLSLSSPHDRGLLTGYVTKLDQAIVEKGIMSSLAGLDDPRLRGGLHAVSDGVVGRISRLIEAALEIALHRDAERIELYDLALAVDRWAIPNGFIKTNPFREGRPG